MVKVFFSAVQLMACRTSCCLHTLPLFFNIDRAEPALRANRARAYSCYPLPLSRFPFVHVSFFSQAPLSSPSQASLSLRIHFSPTLHPFFFQLSLLNKEAALTRPSPTTQTKIQDSLQPHHGHRRNLFARTLHRGVHTLVRCSADFLKLER